MKSTTTGKRRNRSRGEHELKPNSFYHPKTERFAEELGVRPREAWGMLDRLTAITAQYAERGNLGSVFSDAQIARRLDWGGEGESPEQLISALVASGFFDPHSVHRYVLHDWHDHAPDYTKKKVKAAGRGWAANDVPENSGTVAVEIAETSRCGDGTTAGPSIPSLSIPSPSLPILCGAPNTGPPDLSGFVMMLKGEIPVGIDGKTWGTCDAWFAHHVEIIRGEAEAKTGESSGNKFSGAFRSTLMRYWNHKKPRRQSRSRDSSVRSGVSNEWKN
jgi:hypothetical protein